MTVRCTPELERLWTRPNLQSIGLNGLSGHCRVFVEQGSKAFNTAPNSSGCGGKTALMTRGASNAAQRSGGPDERLERNNYFPRLGFMLSAMAHSRTVIPSMAQYVGAIRSARPSKTASGFSLVEVLVSIVVLSFGLLGMVGMQAASLQSNREARLQSSAVVLVRELAETIRGNKVEGIKSSPNNPYLGSFSSPMTATTASYCLNVATTTTACTGTADIANAQMTEWLARVNAELPGARVAICFDSTPFDSNGLPRWACDAAGGVMVIKIGWTRGSTDRTKTGNAALERATIPSVVLPVTAGSST
jgi:type IV pilus assembly protein PilV